MDLAVGADIARLSGQMRRMMRQVEHHIDVRHRLRRRAAHIHVDVRSRPADAELLIFDRNLAVDQVNPPQAAELALVVRVLDKALQDGAEIGIAGSGVRMADTQGK